MTRNLLRGSSAVGIGVMLLVGVVRTQNKAEEREAAVRKLCEAEKPAVVGRGTADSGTARGGAVAGVAGGLAGRFGRSNAPVVVGQGGGGNSSSTTGTPEIALSPATTTPGTDVNLTVKGKFPVGTRFVFDKDSVQVLRERVSANSYDVTLRIPQMAGPAVIAAQAFAPGTCGASGYVPVAVVAGKYAWDLTATNGWKVQLRSEGAGMALTVDGKYEETYTAEFFRNSETKPFQVRKATLSPVGEGLYAFTVSNSTQKVDLGAESFAATQERIMKRMSDPTVSDAEKEKLSAEFSAALEKLGTQVDTAVAQTNDMFSCRPGSLKWDGKAAAEGTLECGTNTLRLTGTMKLVR